MSNLFITKKTVLIFKGMKKIFLTALSSCCIMLTGCSGYLEDMNKNPNQMEMGQISPSGLLQEVVYSGTEVLLYRTWQINGELIQYTVSGTGNNAYHRYVITNSVMESAWSNLYRWAANAEHMQKLAVAKNEQAYEAIAITMKCLLMQNVTDIFGDAPYSEAFKGASENILKPKFDTQQDIYRSIISELEYANTLYAGASDLAAAERDFMYKGDVSKWRKFNNSLYLRVLMRLSNRASEFDVARKISNVFSNSAEWPVFASNEDNATLYYDDVNPFVNMFGSYLESAFTTTGRRPAEQIINMMNEPGDPRISIWFEQDSGAEGWKGAESGKEAQESDNTGVSFLNKENLGSYSSPYSNMKYDEVLFIFAEAAKRGWIPGGDDLASKYYYDAIRASIRYWSDTSISGTEVAEETISKFMENVPYDNTLEQILNQKYVALFWTGFEGWHEYRRTGYPVLEIGSGTQNDHILPTRFAYPYRTIETNPENYRLAVERLRTVFNGADDMKTPVWWSRQAVEEGI